MTGDDNRDNQAALLREGANDLVLKPIEERLLVTKLLFQLRVASCRSRARSERSRMMYAARWPATIAQPSEYRGCDLRSLRAEPAPTCMADIRLEPSWKSRIGDWFAREDMQQLSAFLRQRKAAGATSTRPAPTSSPRSTPRPFDR